MATQIFSLPTTTVFPAGTSTTATFSFHPGITSVTTQFNVQQPDLSDPTKTMTFSLLAELVPGSGVFTLDHGFTWQGGLLDAKHGNVPVQPSITVSVGPLAGLKCKVQMVLSKTLNAGVTVTES